MLSPILPPIGLSRQAEILVKLARAVESVRESNTGPLVAEVLGAELVPRGGLGLCM